MATETDIGVIDRPAAKPALVAPIPRPEWFAPKPRARPFSGYRLANFNPVAATGLVLCALSGLGVIFLALTLIDAWSKV